MSYGEEESYRDDAKLTAMVLRAHDESKEALAPLRDVIWRRAYLFYHCRHDPSMFEKAVRMYPLESALFMPIPFQQVETSTPRIAAGALSADPLVNFSPTLSSQESEDEVGALVRDYAKRMETYENNQFENDIRIRDRLPMWAREAELYGLQWLFLEWLKTKDEDRIKVSSPSIWSVFPDPRAQSIHGECDTQPCRYIQRLLFMPVDMLWEHMIRNPKIGWQIHDKKKLEEFAGKYTGDDDVQKVMQAEVGRISGTQGQGYRPKDEGKRVIKLLDHWEPDKHVVIVGNRADSVPLLKQFDAQFPYKKLGLPFASICTLPLLNELFGISIVENIAGLVHQTNTLVNMRNVGLARAMSGIVLVNTMSGLSAAKMIAQPAGVWAVDGAVPLEECVKMIQYSDPTSRVYDEVDYMHQQIQLTGGGTEPSQGLGTKGVETARGLGYLLEQGNMRFNLKVHSVAMSIAQLARCVLKVNQEYITEDRWTRVTGDDDKAHWIGVGPEVLKRGYEIKVDVRPRAANPSLHVQQFINFVQIASSWPEFNRQEAIMELARLLEIPRPKRMLAKLSSDAEEENVFFLRTGRMPSVRPDDNHVYHLDVHKILLPAAKSMGPQQEQDLATHVMDHLQFAGLVQNPNAPPAGAPAPGTAPPGMVPPGAPAPLPSVPFGRMR